MTYNHAVLGESLELCKDATKWFAEEKIRLEYLLQHIAK